MTKISAQQVFDTVAEHLFTQGAPSANEGGDCLYRGPEGRKCAVGALIPDDKYNPELEGYSIDAVFEALPVDYRPHTRLLRNLQMAHDRVSDTWKWVFTENGYSAEKVLIASAWTSPEALYAALHPVAVAFGLSAEHFKGRQFGPVAA